MENNNHKRKIIITGTGRSGTTFLVQLLTLLGADTGYDYQDFSKNINERSHGGLEKIISNDCYIVKSPTFCTEIPEIIKTYNLDHVFITVRDMKNAANSRIAQGHPSIPGGLWGTDDPKNQKSIILEKFGTLVSDIVLNDISYSFLIFPKFATDPNYCFSILQPFFAKMKISTNIKNFTLIFESVSNPSLIHDYSNCKY